MGEGEGGREGREREGEERGEGGREGFESHSRKALVPLTFFSNPSYSGAHI